MARYVFRFLGKIRLSFHGMIRLEQACSRVRVVPATHWGAPLPGIRRRRRRGTICRAPIYRSLVYSAPLYRTPPPNTGQGSPPVSQVRHARDYKPAPNVSCHENANVTCQENEKRILPRKRKRVMPRKRMKQPCSTHAPRGGTVGIPGPAVQEHRGQRPCA